ncbi:HAMP domain-containing sensor histidine kinase [Bacillus sp. FJAT-27986]|uniref:HAMP domain-containing sensor histidine kinase n=1 Tax=Bacillus sp. FJAT-27986 TaxID=1743146 RepID=UPI000B1DBF39|nr:HAMP domain-containing sensor histidine kinase [Bacillus sp. FJAT-27986]
MKKNNKLQMYFLKHLGQKKKNHPTKRVSLLKYWTTRYLVTLFIGLIVIGFLTGIIIRQSTLNKNLDINKYLAEEVAARILDQMVGTDIQTEQNPEVFANRKKLLEVSGNPSIYVVDVNGKIVIENRSSNHLNVSSFSTALLNSKDEVKQLNNIGGRDYYLVKRPMIVNDTVISWIVVMQSEDELTAVDQEYKLLLIMILSLALLGWVAIYFLSKRLVKPIENVAEAAKQVQKGNYTIELIEEVNEQEVYDLVHSFKEMAIKLEQLEAMRAELLAGVTHELKTPVTSISGLLQAVNDGVVTGEEAKEFLAISLQETTRMQKMVGDLLEFNSFTANAIPVNRESVKIGEVINEMIYQWDIVQDDQLVKVTVQQPKEDMVVSADPLRLQQIMINLLNNSKHAIQGEGTIEVRIYKYDEDHVAIDVQDSGSGIPLAEQDLIFERFYRGEDKKYKIRGLGLGLPFSRMLANAMDGDLVLTNSSEEGTTFTIVLKSLILRNED